MSSHLCQSCNHVCMGQTASTINVICSEGRCCMVNIDICVTARAACSAARAAVPRWAARPIMWAMISVRAAVPRWAGPGPFSPLRASHGHFEGHASRPGENHALPQNELLPQPPCSYGWRLSHHPRSTVEYWFLAPWRARTTPISSPPALCTPYALCSTLSCFLT